MPLNANEDKRKRVARKRPSVGATSLLTSTRHMSRPVTDSTPIASSESLAASSVAGVECSQRYDSSPSVAVTASSSSVLPHPSVSLSSLRLPSSLKPPSLSRPSTTGPVVTEDWSRSVVHPQDDYFLYQSRRAVPPPMNYVQRMEIESRRRQVVELSQLSQLQNSFHQHLSLVSDASTHSGPSDISFERHRSLSSAASEGTASKKLSENVPGRVLFFRQPSYNDDGERRSQSPAGSMDSYYHFSYFRVPSLTSVALSVSDEINAVAPNRYSLNPSSMTRMTGSMQAPAAAAPLVKGDTLEALVPKPSGAATATKAVEEEGGTPATVHSEAEEESSTVSTHSSPQEAGKVSIFAAMMSMSSEELLANPIFCIMTEENAERLLLVEEEHLSRKKYRESLTEMLEHTADGELRDLKTPPPGTPIGLEVSPIPSRVVEVDSPRAGKRDTVERLSASTVSVPASEGKKDLSAPQRNSWLGQQVAVTSKPIVLCRDKKELRPTPRRSTTTGTSAPRPTATTSTITRSSTSARSPYSMEGKKGASSFTPSSISASGIGGRRTQSPRLTEAAPSRGSTRKSNRVDPQVAEPPFRRTGKAPVSYTTHTPSGTTGSTSSSSAFHRTGITVKTVKCPSPCSPSSSPVVPARTTPSADDEPQLPSHGSQPAEASAESPRSNEANEAVSASLPDQSKVEQTKTVGEMPDSHHIAVDKEVTDVQGEPTEDESPPEEEVIKVGQDNVVVSETLTTPRAAALEEEFSTPNVEAIPKGSPVIEQSNEGRGVDDHITAKDAVSPPPAIPDDIEPKESSLSPPTTPQPTVHDEPPPICAGKGSQDCAEDEFRAAMGESTTTSVPHPITNCLSEAFSTFVEGSPLYGSELQEYMRFSESMMLSGMDPLKRGAESKNGGEPGNFLDAIPSAQAEEDINDGERHKWNRMYRRQYLAQLRRKARLVRLISPNSSDEEDEVEEDVDDLILGDNNYHQQNVQFVLDLFGDLWSPEVDVDALRCVEETTEAKTDNERASMSAKKGSSYYAMQALGVIFENPYQAGE